MDKDTSDALAHGLQYLATAALAGVAGAIKYLRQVRSKVEKWNKWEFVLQVATSILAGFTVRWVFIGLGANEGIVHAATSLAGWGGAQGIELAWKKVFGDAKS